MANPLTSPGAPGRNPSGSGSQTLRRLRMERLTFQLGYSVLANGYNGTRRVDAETVEQAIEIFYETWERDGSSRKELGDVWDLHQCMTRK